ncbi:hypothetical protein IJS77_04550 [bacterium]|nr:hypothetical protein [bacterium]
MAFSLVNLLSTITSPATVQVNTNTNNNPFASPDILNNKKDFYAKNRPVPGGYFAGYYNGKPNIVGRKLFIEV